jgi:glycyl-radical enzyme activating protein
MQGIVTDIQRCSVHDGPGIRTTVFLKGCNLRCAWCHNPETLRPQPELRWDSDLCIGCDACRLACASGALARGPTGLQIDPALCQRCGRCASRCYAQALNLVGKTMETEEVLAEVLADREFYLSSGGGMTVSGGEPLFQRAFTLELLRRCREEGIGTALETNMDWPWNSLTALLPLVDVLMTDIKLFDPVRHAAWTGASNARLLANILRLGEVGTRLIIRTPLMAGVNDSEDEIDSIAGMISKISTLSYYELLPYHPLGTRKKMHSGTTEPGPTLAAPTMETLRQLAQIAARHGIEVRVAGKIVAAAQQAVE